MPERARKKAPKEASTELSGGLSSVVKDISTYSGFSPEIIINAKPTNAVLTVVTKRALRIPGAVVLINSRPPLYFLSTKAPPSIIIRGVKWSP
ncbi:MAG: hypothetical protein DRJ98_01810 [Thermoprotei archaeon]|nr:MAG: hypothetical protein DRJ98_01810 [Thermoprotei archaeon]RLF18124.1 MAG: hypothetical protein DRN06_02325 [Thermoprotei archaeon]